MTEWIQKDDMSRRVIFHEKYWLLLGLRDVSLQDIKRRKEKKMEIKKKKVKAISLLT